MEIKRAVEYEGITSKPVKSAVLECFKWLHPNVENISDTDILIITLDDLNRMVESQSLTPEQRVANKSVWSLMLGNDIDLIIW